MAAPFTRRRTPTGTGAKAPKKSANGSRASRRGKKKPFLRKADGRMLRRLPLVGEAMLRLDRPKILLDKGRPSHGSRDRETRQTREGVVHANFRNYCRTIPV